MSPYYPDEGDMDAAGRAAERSIRDDRHIDALKARLAAAEKLIEALHLAYISDPRWAPEGTKRGNDALDAYATYRTTYPNSEDQDGK